MTRALAVVVVAITLLAAPADLSAQPIEGDVPTQEIVPRPNSGRAPEEAGDRGGALQILLLGVVVASVAGVAVHLHRQSKRYRDGYSTSAAQASPPSRKPSR